MHGFPPRQTAGTEQYASRLAIGLRTRGWTVHTLAVAPSAGGVQYARTEEPGLTRIVNNAPYAGLRRRASDPYLDRITAELAADADLVHVQHLSFLSASVRTPVPVVWTLHDAWAWCPAGGLLLRGGQVCEGPGSACPACATTWARDTPALARALGVAGRAGRWVSPATLQSWWHRVPAGLRARALGGDPPPLTPEDLEGRDRTIRAFAGRCARVVSPSRWLAHAAARQGFDVTDVLPHGVDPGARAPAAGDGPFLFVGTLAPHKGPHLVREAWQRAALPVPLRIHGPAGPDAAYVAALPNDGPLDPTGVRAALSGARALVLGSTWPENAPLVILEARAVGCPVIAPAIGGIPELVSPGVDGWLYPPGDIDALARCLREAATQAPPVRPPPTFETHLDALERVYDRAART